MPLERLLVQFGLSQHAARIYLAALELGTASAQDIAKKAGIKRTTTYSILAHLVERGIISKTLARNKTRFVAESPHKLLHLLNELHDDISHALPQLDALYNRHETKPKITFFEGKQAIHAVYEDTLQEQPKEILEWNTNVFFQRFPKEYNYIEKRTGLNIRARRIAGKGSLWDTKHAYLDEKELAQTLVVPRELFHPDVEVNIYNNKVAFMNYAENMSIIIESKAIAHCMRQAYELSWLGAKTVRTNISR